MRSINALIVIALLSLARGEDVKIPQAAYSAVELPLSKDDANFAKQQGTCDPTGPVFTKAGFDPAVPCSTRDVTKVSDPKLVENQVGQGQCVSHQVRQAFP